MSEYPWRVASSTSLYKQLAVPRAFILYISSSLFRVRRSLRSTIQWDVIATLFHAVREYVSHVSH